jgi:hypothetical protein
MSGTWDIWETDWDEAWLQFFTDLLLELASRLVPSMMSATYSDSRALNSSGSHLESDSLTTNNKHIQVIKIWQKNPKVV